MSGWRGRRWRGGGFREVTHAHVLACRDGVYMRRTPITERDRLPRRQRRQMTTVFSQCPPMVINDDEPDGDFHRRALFRGLRGYRFGRARSSPRSSRDHPLFRADIHGCYPTKCRISKCISRFATPRHPATPRSWGS